MADFTTTSRGSGMVTNPPTGSAVQKMVEVCGGSLDATEYAFNQLVDKLKSLGLLDTAGSLIEKFEEFYIALQEQDALRGDAWAGDPACLRTNFQNLQAKLASVAQNMLISAGLDPISMDFALNHSSEFLRGYLVDDNPLDAELIKACDDLFNAWLAENNMISQNGQIYDADDDGKLIREDGKTGVPENINLAKKADAARVKQLLGDPKRSFEAYLAARKIQASTQEVPYPAKSKTQTTTAVPKSEKAASVKQKVSEQEEEVKPGTTPGQSTS